MKILEGKLISTKMQNTAVVEVYRLKPHPLYKKLIRLSKKYKVDNVGFEDLAIGTEVKIQEIKPMSKEKYFKITSFDVDQNSSLPYVTARTSGRNNDNLNFYLYLACPFEGTKSIGDGVEEKKNGSKTSVQK